VEQVGVKETGIWLTEKQVHVVDSSGNAKYSEMNDQLFCNSGGWYTSL